MSDNIHQPDINRIPASLRGLDWRPMDPAKYWSDGVVLLVAVAVCVDEHWRKASFNPRRAWEYSLAVVTVHVDEGMCEVTLGEDSWGWDLDDCDWYVVISE